MLPLTLLLACIAPPAQEPWPPEPPLAGESLSDAGPLPESVSATRNAANGWLCRFSYAPPGKVESVFLAGSFNAWSRDALPMERDDDGHWHASVPLPPGRWLYKFVVDGRSWRPDPRNEEREPDGHGGSNSVLRLGRRAHLSESEAVRGDGRIDPTGLAHDPASPFFFQALGEGRVLVRLQTYRNDVDQALLVRQGHTSLAMHPAANDALLTTWEVLCPDWGDTGRYTFVLHDGETRARHPRIFLTAVHDAAAFRTPEWAKNAIWYQIMVDRFRNGRSANDPPNARPWTSDWFEPSPWEGSDGQTFYEHFVYSRLYGGDLQGLEEKLDYLADLGVNALYLNPVFQSPSHHKYNASNYLHVDERYGQAGDYGRVVQDEDLLDSSTWQWTASDRIFLRFLRAAKARGFRVVLDGVFNHVGTDHPAFQDVRRRGSASPYADWFAVKSWDPFEYEGWAGFGELPVFRKSDTGFASEAVQRHVFEVTRRWMDPDGDGDPRDGIDGWRLDVPNEVAGPFWEEWREHVKSINPDAFIAGEIWSRADEWLDGRRFDAVMNYPFAEAAVAWIGHRERKIQASECDRRLAELRMAYPREASYALMNLLGSHDTDRLASMLENPDRNYDRMNRPQSDNPEYDNGKPGEESYARARLLALLQMTYVGAPMIYYGDEVGMWGADDPTNRKPMLWRDLEPYENPDENFVMEDHLAHYRAVVALRGRHAALRTGSFETVCTDDEADAWIFLRENEEERVLVALNASGETQAVGIPADLAEGDWEVVFGSGGLVQEGSEAFVAVGPLDGVVLAAPKQ